MSSPVACLAARGLHAGSGDPHSVEEDAARRSAGGQGGRPSDPPGTLRCWPVIVIRPELRVGGDPSRVDGVNKHARAAERRCQGRGEGVERVFRERMRRRPHLLREVRAGLDLLVRGARNVYHARRRRRLEQRTHGLDQRPRANDVNLEGVADVGDIDIERRRGVSVRQRARVVDEHVKVAVFGTDVLGDAREIVRIGEVEPGASAL